MKANITAAAIADWDQRVRWVKEVEKRVATGKGSHQPALMRKVSHRKVDEILRYGAKALGIDEALCAISILFRSKLSGIGMNRRSHSKVQDQLGSVGGGNHYCELLCAHNSGEVWIMVHCGSRGYGWQTANHFFYEGAELRGLPKNRSHTCIELFSSFPLLL